MIERADASSQSRDPLQPLQPGQHVFIQNGGGRAPTRWDRSGMVVEVLPYRQYRVKYDGSGRLQVRNRQHLKALIPPSSHNPYPAAPSTIIVEDKPSSPPTPPPPALASTPIRPNPEIARNVIPPSLHASPTPQHQTNPAPQYQPHTVTSITPPAADHQHNTRPSAHEQPNAPDLSQTIPYNLTEHFLRRGTRTRNPPARLSPKLKGKTHIRE